jgi:hypothetical protein
MAQINTQIRFRLSKTQIAILAPGIHLLFGSHQTRQRTGTSHFAYPFRIYPPPRGFDRGIYNQTFMDKTLTLRETLKIKSQNRRWVKIDTFQLRAAVFAIRAHVEYVRLLRRQQKRKDPEVKARLHIDDKSIAQLKAKSHRVIRSLERNMKRANRALITEVGKEQYSALTIAWKAHLRWMRLHIAYFKPLWKPIPGLRKRQQQSLDELMEMAKRGLRNAGYQPPEEKELRRIMRLYTRYARSGRQGHWTIQFLLGKRKDFNSTYYLAQFVIDRSKLTESRIIG